METRKLYKLMSWLSPSFPVGAYTYSHGLEYAVEAEFVTDRASLEEWLDSILRYGSGRVDAMFFNAVYRRDENGLRDLIELASAMRGTSELAQENRLQGQAFLRGIRLAWDNEVHSEFSNLQTPHVISVAETCRLHQIPLKDALTAYLQAFASNIVSAGIRLIPIGHTDAQRTLANLEGVISEVVENALDTPFEDIGSATPMVDWASMRHENQHTRLFRS